MNMLWYSITVLFTAGAVSLGAVMLLRPEWPLAWQVRLERRLRVTLAASPWSAPVYRAAGLLLLVTALWVAVQAFQLLLRR